MSLEVIVRIKDVYGERKVYPVSRHAQAFAMIAGTKTLTDRTINLIKSLGIEIKVEQETL